MNKKSLGDPFTHTAFRLGHEHLALLDQHDRTGEGRSAVLRRILDQMAQQQACMLLRCDGVIVRRQQETAG